MPEGRGSVPDPIIARSDAWKLYGDDAAGFSEHIGASG